MTKDNKKVTPLVTIESIESAQIKLEKELQELNRKKALADRRNLFLSKRKSLEDFLEELSKDDSEGDFVKLNAKITFSFDNPSSTGYGNKEEKFTVSIPDMVESYVVNLLSDINGAIEVIEADLIAY